MRRLAMPADLAELLATVPTLPPSPTPSPRRRHAEQAQPILLQPAMQCGLRPRARYDGDQPEPCCDGFVPRSLPGDPVIDETLQDLCRFHRGSVCTAATNRYNGNLMLGRVEVETAAACDPGEQPCLHCGAPTDFVTEDGEPICEDGTGCDKPRPRRHCPGRTKPCERLALTSGFCRRHERKGDRMDREGAETPEDDDAIEQSVMDSASRQGAFRFEKATA